MAGDPHFASVKLLTHLDGADEATVAVDKSPSAHTLIFTGDAELDTAQKKFGTASMLMPSAGINPDFDNVVLLVDFDGVDASTTFTDLANTPHTLIAQGDAQVDTASKKFGTGAGLFDGAIDRIDVTGDTADFAFGTGDFTIEMWADQGTFGDTVNSLIGRDAWLNDGFLWWVTNLGIMKWGAVGINEVIGTSDFRTGGFRHVAVSRNSGNTRMFLDGVQEGSTGTTVTDILDVGATGIGDKPDNHLSVWDGHIDELRVTKGEGIYTANFTPPVGTFPRS